MISNNISKDIILSNNDLFSNYIHNFLHSFRNLETMNLNMGTFITFKIKERKEFKKINPMLKFATVDDAKDIIEIYKDIYNNTYPYKEMEDENEVKKMIKNPLIEWIVFKDKNNETIGCFTFFINPKTKMGYLRGLNLKRKYLGKVDILKSALASFIVMYKKYENKIFRWYGESRTAHTKSQFVLGAGGFKPVAFYPNKDIFYNKIESDILLISYDERALREYRSKKIPQILPEVENGYLYSNKRYQLGNYKIVIPKFNLNKRKLKKRAKKIKRTVKIKKFGYKYIKFYFEDSNSFFKFLYTPTVQNFEKTKYNVKNVEEFYLFVKEFIKSTIEFNVRYYEIYISAYNPLHQKIINDAGLSPRGYIPSWQYNEEKEEYEDYILFNNYKGNIDKNIRLLEECQSLVRCLNI